MKRFNLFLITLLIPLLSKATYITNFDEFVSITSATPLSSILKGKVSELNSTSTPLAASATFTGQAEDVSNYQTIVVSAKTDSSALMYVDFSIDGTNWDSAVPISGFSITSGTNEVHAIRRSKKFARIRITNTDGVAQSYLRAQTILDAGTNLLTSPINSTIQQDADAITVRSIDLEFAIARGLFQNVSIVNKFGLNSDIDTGAGEDLCEVSGFLNWPTSAETIQVFSASANDTSAGTGARTARVIGLDANYNVISETVTLNGATPVTTTQAFLRAHTASVQTAGSGGVNAGIITFRQSSTTANVFLSMQAGRNQTNCSAYTVPAGHTAYMRALHSATGSASNVTGDGNIWTRSFGSVFRSRRPFFTSDSFRLSDIIYGGLVFTEKSDIILRINAVSANNTPINGGYDLILVKD